MGNSTPRLTALWQSKTPHEFEWVTEIFGPVIDQHVFDGDHSLVCDNVILFDAFIDRFDEAYYRKFAGKNAFLVHFLDETYAGGYSRYQNFRGVVRKHWSSGFEATSLRFLPLGYNNGFAATAHTPLSSERDYLWSFAGAIGKSTRPDAIAALSPLKPSKLVSTDGFETGDGIHQLLTPSDCAELFRASVFSPAPMGNVNLECYRTYEALEAGSIPLVERRWSIDYYRELLGDHPMPTFSSWDRAAEFVAHYQGNFAAANSLQRECIQWWSAAKSALSLELCRFVTTESQPRSGSNLRWFARMPLWNYLELLRHHDRKAIARRLRRHIDRLMSEGRYRSS